MNFAAALAITLIFSSSVHSDQVASTWSEIYKAYPDIPLEKIYYYLLPSELPLKKELDAFFSEARVTEDAQSLELAGFTENLCKTNSQTIVTCHPKFPGYVFKLFRDDQHIEDHVNQLFRRIIGALAAKSAIEETGSEELFIVPKKWIYLIPQLPSKYSQKQCLIIAEKIDLLPDNENLKKWKSTSIPQATLEKLYSVLQKAGLSDSIYPYNIPFTRDGKIAFVDTECAYWWPEPPKFPKLAKFLSNDNKAFWLSLTGEASQSSDR